MSFSHNPYKHIEFVEKEDGKWVWYCHGCGEECHVGLPIEMASTLLASFKRHLWSSHKRKPDDFDGWSKY